MTEQLTLNLAQADNAKMKHRIPCVPRYEIWFADCIQKNKWRCQRNKKSKLIYRVIQNGWFMTTTYSLNPGPKDGDKSRWCCGKCRSWQHTCVRLSWLHWLTWLWLTWLHWLTWLWLTWLRDRRWIGENDASKSSQPGMFLQICSI